MIQKIVLILGLIVSSILINTELVYCQAVATEDTVAQETQAEPDVEWLWSEVVSVDTQKNELLVKYLDYETDQEKEMAISVSNKTTYENIKSLNEIKPNDTVSIDYTVSPKGQNIAKNISVEKPEDKQPMPQEAVPEGSEITTEEASP